ncbi:DNA translocase FtsK [Mycoplasma sp. SG1]|uniref:DNA translocase FtsK n=1 Tax=Mycoplasma sp. SG1 TaxID=2810348 RepID=UPI00202448D5|nr:DNA translocase FtsK [Mycoplasma sp. SG1]URM53217.1 DNA translocase FtsK [Mycoplasma sp. SG1]
MKAVRRLNKINNRSNQFKKRHKSFFKSIKWQVLALFLLVFVTFSFVSIFLKSLKVDHYTYNLLFGSIGRYIFYFFSFWFLILEIFRRSAHPIINRKIVSLAMLTISITIFIAMAKLMGSHTSSQALNQFIKDWENNKTITSGVLQTVYVAFFLLIPIHGLSVVLASVVNILFFLIVFSVLLTNHSYYLYYWCFTFLIYWYRKRSIYKQAIKKYQFELVHKEKEAFLKKQKQQILLQKKYSKLESKIEENQPTFASQPSPEPNFNDSKQFLRNKNNNSDEMVISTHPFPEATPNSLQSESKITEEIWRKAHYDRKPAKEDIITDQGLSAPTINKNVFIEEDGDKVIENEVNSQPGSKLENKFAGADLIDEKEIGLFELPEEVKEHNKKLIDETKTIVTNTIDTQMPKPEKINFFQSLETDEVDRKKIFSLPNKIKAKKAKIRSAIFGDDIILTPFKRMSTEEVMENQEKNERLNNESFSIKELNVDQEEDESHAPVVSNSKSSKKLSIEKAIEDNPDIVYFAYDLSNYKFPRLDFLKVFKSPSPKLEKETFVKQKKDVIVNTFKAFNMEVLSIEAHISSSLIQYRLRLPENVNLSRVLQIQNNLKLGLAVKSLRVQAPIPGMSMVGIETESPWNELISLKTLIQEQILINNETTLTLPIGRNVNGKCQVLNIKKLPHLLIAGATGTGKSVCINTILIALLLTNSPNDLRLILIDPKKVEMTAYQNIPHLLVPVIKTTDKAKSAFIRLIKIMDDRYHFLAQVGFKNIADYNRSCSNSKHKLSYIVVIIDELADLMLTSGKVFETYILRIAQLGRAAGIHLILSTQRPSVNIITGVIKANIVARISFQVGSAIDSKIILDQGGAENLLGNGDMLYQSPSIPHPVRIQGPFITDGEINEITHFIINQRSPQFLNDETHSLSDHSHTSSQNFNDSLYPEIKAWVETELTQISSSFLQRKYRIGFNRAASIIDQLEKDKVIGPQDGSRPRKVLR